MWISLDGTKKVAPKALVEILSGDPEDYNSIDDRENVVPESKTISGIRPKFNYQVPAFSIVVLKVKEL